MLRKKKVYRLSWGGLYRMLGRYRGINFDHDHIYYLAPDGRKIFLNLKYDALGRPYFVEVKD